MPGFTAVQISAIYLTLAALAYVADSWTRVTVELSVMSSVHGENNEVMDDIITSV